jgi:hypothetical protein
MAGSRDLKIPLIFLKNILDSRLHCGTILACLTAFRIRNPKEQFFDFKAGNFKDFFGYFDIIGHCRSNNKTGA